MVGCVGEVGCGCVCWSGVLVVWVGREGGEDGKKDGKEGDGKTFESGVEGVIWN